MGNEEDKKLELLRYNYEKLHEKHQSEIKNAWMLTNICFILVGGLLGYGVKNGVVGADGWFFLALAMIFLFHNLIGKRLSHLNNKREEHLTKIEEYFTQIIRPNNEEKKSNLSEFRIYKINVEAKKKKWPLHCSWVYWIIFAVLLSLAVVNWKK